ncbi:MAG: hypothetical protein HBSAPP03_24060 [Phycisphaerae bacterium]|nr:MAG: hypothetical protein HBSAPP03_24060 [Phycisphaerae bacterium]
MHPILAASLGLLLGLGIAVLMTRVQVRRSLAKARAAERRARAAERLAELGAMTGGLAHEIKNPLSTIGLNAQLIAEGLDDLADSRPLDPADKQRLARRAAALRREVERLRGILTDFLTYAGELRLDLKPIDLNEVVADLVEFLSPQAQQQGVRLRADPAPGPMSANADAGLMKQAVLNLMLNALQAMAGMPSEAAASRELIVRTARASDPDGQATLQIHVIDTGPGIAPDVLPKLFTPYFTTKAGGSGLGLPTTRRIVEAHQGRIDVHSEPGKGSDFVIALPA